MSSHHFTRRAFLRGAGVAMALPWMESLPVWGDETKSSAPGSQAPVRLAVLFSGNGFHSREWWAKGEGKAMELGKVLEPLTPYREKLLFIRGLYNEEALKGNIHSSQTGNLLSGAPLSSGGEIKSGTSEVTMTPQLRIQEFIARQLGIRWNLIVDRDTPVSQEVMDAIAGRGGGVYRKIPGLPGLYQRVLRNGETENVRLSGVSGRGGVGLKVDPVTEEEQQRIGAAIRNLPGSHRLDEPPSAPEPPPAAEEPSSPLVPEEQFDDAWENVPVEPVEPGEPGLGGVRPGEEPFEELFEEIIP